MRSKITVRDAKSEIIVYAVSMILKAALFAASWAGKTRKRELKNIAKMPIDEKDKEIVFLRDRVYQLEIQDRYQRSNLWCSVGCCVRH